MIIVPEIKTVVILVPRTGSGSLHRTIKKTYPRSFMPYRHMEADGVPIGYDWWHKVGVVREPVERLYSAYKYLRNIAAENFPLYPQEIDLERASAQKPFEEWLLTNEIPFAPCRYHNDPSFTPFFAVRHFIPENRKSQFIYLRPDLGTEIFKFSKMGALYDALGLEQPAPEQRSNVTEVSKPPEFRRVETWTHIHRHFAWDLEHA